MSHRAKVTAEWTKPDWSLFVLHSVYVQQVKNLFKRATKTQSRLRLALVGPSGSGKTYTALALAQGLSKSIALIDTERGSASKYADQFMFDVLEIQSFHPKTSVEAI